MWEVVYVKDINWNIVETEIRDRREERIRELEEENKKLKERIDELEKCNLNLQERLDRKEEVNKKLREELSAYDREYFDEDKKAKNIFKEDDTYVYDAKQVRDIC